MNVINTYWQHIHGVYIPIFTIYSVSFYFLQVLKVHLPCLFSPAVYSIRADTDFLNPTA